MDVLKREFQLSKFFFTPDAEHEASWTVQSSEGALWGAVPHLFIRAGLFAFMQIALWKGVADDHSKHFLIFLTNWDIILLNFSLLVQLFAAVFIVAMGYTKHSTSMPLAVKFVCFIRAVSQPLAILVTIAYWTLVYTGGHAPMVDIWVHAFNSVAVVLDVFLSCTPVRLLHTVYVALLGAIYTVWSVIYHGNTGENIYTALNWDSGHVGTTVLLVLGLMFIGLPLINLFLFGCVMFRNYCAPKAGGRGDSEEEPICEAASYPGYGDEQTA